MALADGDEIRAPSVDTGTSPTPGRTHPAPTLPPQAPRTTLSPNSPRTLVIGLLGGIASGKSQVARLLAGPDGRVLDADAMAHRALAAPELAERLVSEFGPKAIDRDGNANRKHIASQVFGHPERLARLESWIHPRVRANIWDELAAARAAGVPICVLDVPLLLEHDREHRWVAECDALVFVEADLADRERRAAAKRSWGPGELAAREAAQLSLDEKQRRAHHVVRNTGSLDDLAVSVGALRAWLLSAARGPRA